MFRKINPEITPKKLRCGVNKDIYAYQPINSAEVAVFKRPPDDTIHTSRIKINLKQGKIRLKICPGKPLFSNNFSKFFSFFHNKP
jgi:hypothetical protein